MKRTLCLFLALILAVGICFSAPVTITASAAFTLESGTEHTVGAVYIDSTTGVKFKITDIETKQVEVCGYSNLQHYLVIPATVNISENGGGTLAYSVTAIGASAFANCNSLYSVVIPEGVITIGENAFYFCNYLRGVTIPESVTSIGAGAFSVIGSIANVNVPCKWDVTPLYKFSSEYNQITVTIADHAYKDGVCEACGYECPGHTYELAICTNCSYVCHHETVTDGVCGVCGGTYCGKTESDTVVYFYNESTKTLTISGEGEMADFTDTTMPWYSYRSEIATIVINKGVTSIGKYSFYYCTALTSVTIPDGVTTIGSCAFVYCTALPSVTIPGSVTSIGSYAFSYCSELPWVTIPDSVTEIGEQAFIYCTKVGTVKIGAGVTNLSKEIFARCTALASVTIPDGVTTIGAFAFYDCTSLTTIEIPDSVTTIGANAFKNCTALTIIEIPDSVTTIGSNAFNGCTSLTTIEIPDNITSIEISTFEGCTALTSVTIPDSVTTIGANAFKNCTALTTVNAPCNWNENPLYTFDESVALTIPKHTIENNACTTCEGSKCGATESDKVAWVYDQGTLYINGTGAMADYTTKPWDNYKSEITTVVIGNGVTKIGNNAFKNCTSLTTIEIPDSVTTIGENAFNYCTALESIDIPDSVTTIGTYAFNHCTSLTSVTIPESITEIGGLAFFDCTKLTTVNVPCNWDGSIYSFAESKLKIAEHDTTKTATCISKAECSVCGEYGELDADNHISDNYPYIDNGDGTHTKTHECGVAVGEPEDHSFDESGCCEFCKYQCPHQKYTNGMCDVCGCYCPHTNTEPVYKSYEDNTNQHYKYYECCGVNEWAGYHEDENGDTKCDECEVQLVAKADLVSGVSQGVSMGDNYFADLEYAVDRVNAVWGEELILLSDATIAKGKTITLERAILNTNGNKLTVNGTLVLPDSEYTGATIPDGVIGSGTIKIGENSFKLADNGKWCCAEESQHTSSVQTCVGYLCELCGNYYGEANDNHDIVIDKAVEATCTKTGLTEGQHCTRCNAMTIIQEEVPALNHKGTLIQVEAKAKTCTTVGWEAYEYCTACDYTTKVEIPASHEIVKVNAKAKTCTTVGWDAYEYCKDCNYTTYVEIPASHELQEVKAKAPTCEATGYDAYKYCTECDYTTYVEKAKLGHDIVTDKAVAPTCTKTGLTEGSHCTRCDGATVAQNVVPALNHDLVSHAGKAATCTENGYYPYNTCSRCDYTTYKEETAKGHNIVKDPAVAPTCTTSGKTEGSHCTRCNGATVAQKEVAALGHKLTLVGKKDATFESEGHTGAEVCSVCNKTINAGSVISKLTFTTPVVTAVANNSGIKVNWNNVENAKSYVLYKRVFDATANKWSKWKIIKTDLTNFEYLDSDVVLGTKYRYTVRAKNGDTLSPYKTTTTVKYNVTPTVKVANASNGIKVSWSTAANATGYRVYRSTLSNGKWSNWKNMGTAKATKTSWIDKSVKSNVTYKYTVRAVYNKVLSSYNKVGASVLFLTTPTVKIANSASGIKVSWNKIAGAKGYYVYSSQFDPATNKWSKWVNRGTVTKTNWTDKTVKSGETYKYTVRAINGKTLSAYKGIAGLIYLAQPTVKIANASNGIKVSWNKVDGVTGYTVYSSTYDAKTKKWSSWKNRGTAKADKTSWVDKNVKSGVKYKYTVRAVNGKTKSTYVSSGALIYLAQPIVTVKSVSNGINVSWTQCAGSTGYTVYRSELVNGEWSKWTNMGTAKSDKKSWTDKKAKNGVTYKYTVRAVNGKVKSSYKASSSITK